MDDPTQASLKIPPHWIDETPTASGMMLAIVGTPDKPQTKAPPLSLDQLAAQENLDQQERNLLERVLQHHPTLTPQEALRQMRLGGM